MVDFVIGGIGMYVWGGNLSTGSVGVLRFASIYREFVCGECNVVKEFGRFLCKLSDWLNFENLRRHWSVPLASCSGIFKFTFQRACQPKLVSSL